MRDIGIYFGQVFLNNHSNIKWGFYTKPKTDFFVNLPVLLGFEDRSFQHSFKLNFEPTHMVCVQAANIFDDTQKETDLYDLYLNWTK